MSNWIGRISALAIYFWFEWNFFEKVHLHIKGELYFSFKVAVVHLEEAVNEFSQVDVVIFAQVEHWEKSFADDARQIGIGQQSDFVDAFTLITCNSLDYPFT